VKLTPARVEAFLAAPDPAIRAILCYGPDGGLVRERADRIARAVVSDPADPFRVAFLPADALAGSPGRLADEAQQLSLVPGRRVIRVREAGDTVGGLFERFLAKLPPGDALILVEAGDLATRSSLRRAFEVAKRAAAIACYADDAEQLRGLVRGVLAAHRITASADAIQHLVEHLGSDRGLSRQELEKLALYVGDGGTLHYADAATLVGDSAALTLEDVVFAAAEGDAAALERSLSRAFEEGEAPVTILRAELRHFQRLFLAGARLAAGASAEDAMGSLRPTVFFRRRDRFRHQLELWPPRRAAQALQTLSTAELDAKRTGLPAEAICRDALLRIVRGAGLQPHRRPQNSH